MTNGMLAISRMSLAILIALAGVVSTAVAADESASRWSLGMQLGQARGETGSDSVASAAELTPMNYDMAATFGGSNRFGWRVFTGYRFTNYLAIHLGYADLGEAHSRYVQPSMAIARMAGLDERVVVQSVSGVDLGLQLKLPLSDRVSVDVRGGKYYWRANTHIEGLWMEGSREAQRTTRRDADEFFGAGLEVSVMNDLSATLGWTRYQVGSEPVALWTVGALYRFGIY